MRSVKKGNTLNPELQRLTKIKKKHTILTKTDLGQMQNCGLIPRHFQLFIVNTYLITNMNYHILYDFNSPV